MINYICLTIDNTRGWKKKKKGGAAIETLYGWILSLSQGKNKKKWYGVIKKLKMLGM